MRLKRLRRNVKKASQRLHSKKRASERYGLELDDRELAHLVSNIKKQKGTFLEKISNRQTVWKIETTDGTSVVVVYDKLRKEIATFLPPHAAEVRRNSKKAI